MSGLVGTLAYHIAENEGGGGEENTNWFPPNCWGINGNGVTQNADGSLTVEEGASGELWFEFPILPCDDGYVMDFGIDMTDSGENFNLSILCVECCYKEWRKTGGMNFGNTINIIGEHFVLEMCQFGENEYVRPTTIAITFILGFAGEIAESYTLYPRLNKGTELKPWQPYEF